METWEDETLCSHRLHLLGVWEVSSDKWLVLETWLIQRLILRLKQVVFSSLRWPFWKPLYSLSREAQNKIIIIQTIQLQQWQLLATVIQPSHYKYLWNSHLNRSLASTRWPSLAADLPMSCSYFLHRKQWRASTNQITVMRERGGGGSDEGERYWERKRVRYR